MSSVAELLGAAGLGPVSHWPGPQASGSLVTQASLSAEDPVEPRTRPCLAPADEEVWRGALALAGENDWTVRLAGGDTKRRWLPLPEDVDLVLSTAAWRGVVAYEPADGTLTARTGTSMAELAAVVAEGGHHLSPEVALPERATLGGVLAASQSGLDRLRPGGIRDALLGARVLLADGSSSQSGGRLVKNVTGYDLHRLWCGSFGSLCAILEVSLRLGPSLGPPHVLVLACDTLEQGLRAAHTLRELPVRPVAVGLEARSDAEEVQLVVVLGGLQEVRQEETRTVRARFPQTRELLEEDAASARARLRDAANPQTEHLVVQGPPLQLAARLAVATRDELPAGSLCIHPLVAEATFVPDALGHPDELPRLAARLRSQLRSETGPQNGPESGAVRVVVRDGRTPPQAQPSNAARRMHARLAESFDPHGRFARASFWATAPQEGSVA